MHWPRKSAAAFKNEMLRALLYLQPYVISLIHSGDITMRAEARSLLDVLREEYGGRDDKDQLRFEDLRPNLDPANSHIP